MSERNSNPPPDGDLPHGHYLNSKDSLFGAPRDIFEAFRGYFLVSEAIDDLGVFVEETDIESATTCLEYIDECLKLDGPIGDGSRFALSGENREARLEIARARVTAISAGMHFNEAFGPLSERGEA